MNKITKETLQGALLGLIVCALGAVLYALVMFSEKSLEATFNMLYHNGLLPKVITLGTLPNVLVFHLLIRQNKMYKARGVLLAVVVLAVMFAILKFS